MLKFMKMNTLLSEVKNNMKTKNLDRDATIEAINLLKQRVEFNNELNKFVRSYMKKSGLDKTFNGYRDEPTEDMKEQLLRILTNTAWMPMSLKQEYARYCASIFGQVYGPHVNTYVLKDLHDCEKHLAELEKAYDTRSEENDEFKVERDVEHNRLNIIFDYVPDAEVRSCLKKNGFKWSPYLGVWTRQLTPEAEKSLEKIKQALNIN